MEFLAFVVLGTAAIWTGLRVLEFVDLTAIPAIREAVINEVKLWRDV